MKTDLGILVVLAAFLLTVHAPVGHRAEHGPNSFKADRASYMASDLLPGERWLPSRPAQLGTIWCHMIEVALLPPTPSAAQPRP
jgi:hypothetical protein